MQCEQDFGQLSVEAAGLVWHALHATHRTAHCRARSSADVVTGLVVMWQSGEALLQMNSARSICKLLLGGEPAHLHACIGNFALSRRALAH